MKIPGLERARFLLRSQSGIDSGWFVECNGQTLAQITQPKFEDMFWMSYAVETVEGCDPSLLYDESVWIEGRIDYRNRESGELVTHAFAGGGESPIREGRISMRGLYLSTDSLAAGFWFGLFSLFRGVAREWRSFREWRRTAMPLPLRAALRSLRSKALSVRSLEFAKALPDFELDETEEKKAWEELREAAVESVRQGDSSWWESLDLESLLYAILYGSEPEVVVRELVLDARLLGRVGSIASWSLGPWRRVMPMYGSQQSDNFAERPENILRRWADAETSAERDEARKAFADSCGSVPTESAELANGQDVR